MQLVHVVPHIDQEAAGPSYSVPRLCQSLAQCGNHVELSCLAARELVDGVTLDLHSQWPVMPRFAISSSLVSALWRKARRVDVVHNHSLWSMVNVATGWVVPGKRAKLVTSPRGTLSAWALSRSKSEKRILWPFQRRVLAKADLLHATSMTEYQEIREQGFMAPVAILPNGIDLPETRLADATAVKAGVRTLLYLSRIHPIKGLDRLMHSWRQLQTLHGDWRLVIAGRGDASYIRELQAMAVQLDLKRVEFAGPVYGNDKAQAYIDADLFVLPTHSENFGMVVAEALAHGCPVVVSKGAPWSEVQTESCGWWTANDIESLTASLHTAMSLDSGTRKAMGTRGRAWMEKDYGWQSVGRKMNSSYEWLVGGGECPPWIRVD